MECIGHQRSQSLTYPYNFDMCVESNVVCHARIDFYVYVMVCTESTCI